MSLSDTNMSCPDKTMALSDTNISCPDTNMSCPDTKMSCPDTRTNTAQFAVGKCALAFQLHALGIYSKKNINVYSNQDLPTLVHIYSVPIHFNCCSFSWKVVSCTYFVLVLKIETFRRAERTAAGVRHGLRSDAGGDVRGPGGHPRTPGNASHSSLYCSTVC